MTTGAGAIGGTGDAGTNATGDVGGNGSGAGELSWVGKPESIPRVQGKGWKTPDDALDSYWNLEKILGERAAHPDRLAVIPGPESSAEEWSAFYAKAGRPEKVDGYELDTVPEGPLRDQFRSWAHEAGLSTKQAQALAAKFVGFSSATEQEQQAGFERDAEVALGKLRKDWGAEYEANIQAGRQFARRFDLDEDALDALERAWGTEEMLTRLASWGRAFGEHRPAAGTQGGPLGQTPASAQQQIEELKKDAEFSAKLLAGNPDAMKKWTDLHKLAYPG